MSRRKQFGRWLVILCLVVGSAGAETDRAISAVAMQTSSSEMDELPAEDRNLDKEQRKRLRVAWEKPNRIVVNRSRRGNGRPYLEISGKLSLLQADGKTLQPVDWPFPIQVVITRRPDEKPDWSRWHDQRDSLWDDTLVGRDFIDCRG